MLRVEYKEGEIYFPCTNRLATSTIAREDLTALLARSFDRPLILHNGRIAQSGDLVDAIAAYYHIDRHMLGNKLHMMQIETLRANPELLDELKSSHGVDKVDVESVGETAV